MLQKTPHSLVYLSAEELGITARERAGLIEVRDDLASGRVRHQPHNRGNRKEPNPRSPLFNMWDYNVSTDCGTAHCIAGFMMARGHLHNKTAGHLGSPFAELFYADNVAVSRQDLTVQQAVRAIDHFLAGAGSECWAMALQDIPA